MSANLRIDWIASQKEFAHAELTKDKSNGGVEWDFPQLWFFYTERGYFIYRTSVDRFIPIRVIDNIVKIVGKKELTDEVIHFILKDKPGDKRVHQFALKKIKEATSDDFLITLPEKQVNFRKDRKDAMQLYFQNCIVKITADKVTTHPYTTLNGYIWETQILQREYIESEILPTGNFATFISNISNHEEERANALCAAFGFYLHNYKDAAYCPIIILNDEGEAQDGGGTGKSLFFEAIGQFIKMVTEDGEMFSFDKSFAYQRVTPDTRLLFFDDAKKGFPLKKLKSFSTGGITTEKKGKDAVFTSFSDSPKIGISTNYGIDNSDNPLSRRSLDLEISKYYNKKRKPSTEFGRMMFLEWPSGDEQWIQFDNYAIECCKIFLQNGLIEQQLIHLPEKKLRTQTNEAFLEFMEDFQWQYEIGKKEMLSQFIAAYTRYRTSEWLTINFFTKWLKAYCEFHKITIDTEKRDSTGNIRVYKFDNIPIRTPHIDSV